MQQVGNFGSKNRIWRVVEAGYQDIRTTAEPIQLNNVEGFTSLHFATTGKSHASYHYYTFCCSLYISKLPEVCRDAFTGLDQTGDTRYQKACHQLIGSAVQPARTPAFSNPRRRNDISAHNEIRIILPEPILPIPFHRFQGNNPLDGGFSLTMTPCSTGVSWQKFCACGKVIC